MKYFGCSTSFQPADVRNLLPVSVKVDGPKPEADRAESFIRNLLGAKSNDSQTIVFVDSGGPFRAQLGLHVAVTMTADTNGVVIYNLTTTATNNFSSTATQAVPLDGTVAQNVRAKDWHWVVRGTALEFKTLCEKVAEEFDKNVLIPERQRLALADKVGQTVLTSNLDSKHVPAR